MLDRRDPAEIHPVERVVGQVAGASLADRVVGGQDRGAVALEVDRADVVGEVAPEIVVERADQRDLRRIGQRLEDAQHVADVVVGDRPVEDPVAQRAPNAAQLVGVIFAQQRVECLVGIGTFERRRYPVRQGGARAVDGAAAGEGPGDPVGLALGGGEPGRHRRFALRHVRRLMRKQVSPAGGLGPVPLGMQQDRVAALQAACMARIEPLRRLVIRADDDPRRVDAEQRRQLVDQEPGDKGAGRVVVVDAGTQRRHRGERRGARHGEGRSRLGVVRRRRPERPPQPGETRGCGRPGGRRGDVWARLRSLMSRPRAR